MFPGFPRGFDACSQHARKGQELLHLTLQKVLGQKQGEIIDLCSFQVPEISADLRQDLCCYAYNYCSE